MTPERLMALAAARGIDPTRPQSRGGVPAWASTDAAQAASGLEPHCWAAMRYRWMRDDTARGELFAKLMLYAVDLAEREDWPTRVQREIDGKTVRTPYLEDLVRLALLEEHEGFLMRSITAWPALMKISDANWQRSVRPRYEAIRGRLDVWCDIARSHMRHRMLIMNSC